MLKNFIDKKGIGFYLMLATSLLSLLSLITYSIAESSNDVGANKTIILMLVLVIVGGLGFSFKDFFGIGPIILNVFVSIAFGILIFTKFADLVWIYYGVGPDGQGATLSPALLGAIIFFGLMWLTSIASSFLKSEKNLWEV